MKTKIRISLDIHPDEKKNLEALQGKSKSATLIGLIRRACGVYSWVLEAQASGKIIFESKDGTQETVRFL